MFEFDRDTAAIADGEGRYRVHVSDGWNIGPNPNGGYVLSLLTSAMAQEVPEDHPHLLTVSAHYLRPTSPAEEASVTVESVRHGRRHTHLQARLEQGRERVRALAAYGNLDTAEGPTLVRTEPPEIPPPDDCRPRSIPGSPAPAPPPSAGAHGGPHAGSPAGAGVGPPPSVAAASTFMGRFDTRLSPSTGWLAGERTGIPCVVGWTRFADGREPDLASLPLFADALPPAVFELGPAGWVPTIELTVHVRARPEPGWLLARFETRALVDGYLEEDGEIWDSAGRLVAQSRQLALLLPAG